MSEKFYKIGVIGYGFVGKALVAAFATKLGDDRRMKFCVYDPLYANSKDPGYYSSVADVVNECEYNFICVPTPTNFDTKRQDLSILKQVVEEAAGAAEGTNKLLIIKSTVLPGTTARFENIYPDVLFAHNPEFLREKTFIKDFLEQENVIIGANRDVEIAYRIQELYIDAGIGQLFLIMSPSEAEIVKYTINCFLATKVAFFNEIKQICDQNACDYDEVVDAVLCDDRIGKSHTEVPGHDGKRGFGGKCFPKDLVALAGHMKHCNLLSPVLDGAWRKNCDVRGSAEWLEIEGASSTRVPGPPNPPRPAKRNEWG